MQTVTITLNGREVSGHTGTTILHLAQESGIAIPTLCHDPHLTPIGACRVCLVENEQTRALMAACVTPISPGMVIQTHSPRVIGHRKNIVKLLLASHPDSCLVCDKGNRCRLRELAAELGIGWVNFQRIPQMATIEEVNPFVERDLSKCVLCAKCIRSCQELVIEGAIDYFGRGFANIPATYNNAPLEKSECTFCGVCVALCPTGALKEREQPYRGTRRDKVTTTCPFCGCGCNIDMEVKDNRIVRVLPTKEPPLNHGMLCVRGSYGLDFIHSPDRLTKPLIKENGRFVEATWERALEEAASQFKGIKEKHGPHSLSVLGSAKCTNEENYLLQRFTRSVLGTNNIDNGSRLYGSPTRLGLGFSIGYSGSTGCIDDLDISELIMVVGAEPAVSAPIAGYAIKRAVKYKGAKLIVIDPRETRLASFAHLWLRPKIGTDVALLNSLAKVIVDEGLLDEEFVERRTDNFEAMTSVLEKYSPEYAEAVTGIPRHHIHAASRFYAGAGRAAIVYGNGITQQPNGTEAVRALANLALLTGNIGRKGGGIHALQRENNAQGACDMGVLPDFLPGYQAVADARMRRPFEEKWGVSLPSRPGLTALEFVEQAKEGTIRGLYIMGENPVLSFPDTPRVIEWLASLDFLVVQDMFLTESAKHAHVVLPAASFAEKEGTFTNFEGRVNRVRKAIEPPGESLADWEIILRLADKMGHPLSFSSLEGVMDEIGDVVPLYEGYTDSERLHKTESVAWGKRRTCTEHLLRGFARFSPVEYVPPLEGAMADYPFTLLAGSILGHFGTGTRSSRASRSQKFLPQAFMEIGESDAKKLELSHSDSVKLVSPVAELTAAVAITDTLPEGTVFMPISFPESPVNRLFGIVLDSESLAPSLKACPVRIERMESHE